MLNTIQQRSSSNRPSTKVQKSNEKIFVLIINVSYNDLYINISYDEEYDFAAYSFPLEEELFNAEMTCLSMYIAIY